MNRIALACAALIATSTVAPGRTATPREILTNAAFQTPDKPAALALVNQALNLTQVQLNANPADREAQLQHAFALGYRAKLTRSPGEAKQTRALFEWLVAANPRDPEAQLGLAGWHLDAIADGFLTASVLGARKPPGLAGIDQAVALGGNRAFFKSFAAMMRIRLNPKDVATARALAEAASAGSTATPLDRIGKRDADAILIPLRAGDGKAAAGLAERLLPFGRLR